MSTTECKKFYDVHCHAMNLSHPNLLSFIKRLGWKVYAAAIAAPVFLCIEKLPIISAIFGIKTENIVNLLSLMENDLGNYFLLLEYYLKQTGNENIVSTNNTFTIGDITYNKIVLTPLLMDFGSKRTSSETFYGRPPQKPIQEQVIDVFNGINKYFKNELVYINNEIKLVKSTVPKEKRLFEIYPFLGLNTKNYDGSTVDPSQKIREMLEEKYFKKDQYRGNQSDLFEKMGTFNGNIDDMGTNFFAGIKVYPPLGFDPWPNDASERKKVEYLYGFCCENKIPITTHCSDGGFKVDSNSQCYVSPARWKEVLKQKDLATLKLNFAHFGKQDKWFSGNEWQNSILKLIAQYDNVYADFSCNAFEDDYYKTIKELIEKQTGQDKEKLKTRILFGTDFMINLLWTHSYNHYLKGFIDTGHICEEKDYFCNINPERFLGF